jgi:hypothetical protein
MSIPISSKSFIDIDYFNIMASEELVSVTYGQSFDEIRLIHMINSVIGFMEKFCNRTLKARDFSYLPADTSSYDSKNSIFDAPNGNTLWFPTCPINSITTFMISDEVITPATDYQGSDGYILYSTKGCLVYDYGFDYPYRQNIKVKWNGGYVEGTDEYNELKYLQYLFTKQLFDSDPINDGITSETFSNYSYKTGSIKDVAEYFGIPMFIFNRLASYRRHYFS